MCARARRGRDKIDPMRLAIDAHADTVQRILDLDERFDDPASAAEVSLAKARAGGLAAQFFSIWVDPATFPGETAWPRTRRMVEAVRAEAGRGAFALARTGRDVRAAMADGRFAALMGVEGAHALGADGEPVPLRLERLAWLAGAGARYLAPTWSNSNDFGGSSGDGGRHRGLSDAGLALCDACVAHGILLDASHASDPAFEDLAAFARGAARPLIASHSSARALAEHPRNLTDAQLRTIADTGGVASVNFCPAFLDERFRAAVTAAASTPEAKAAQEAARRSHSDPGRASFLAFRARAEHARAVPAPGVERLCDHILHMVSVAGEDHIGLGSDFDGVAAVTAGLEDVSRLPALGDALAARGLSERAIAKVFRDNWLRVLDEP
jgi:membrane dipeptidase